MSENSEDKHHRQKSGGRQKGTPNKTTALLRFQIADIVEAELDTLMANLSMMKPKEHADTIIQLAKFVIPTQKSVDFEDLTPKENNKKFNFNFVKKNGE